MWLCSVGANGLGVIAMVCWPDEIYYVKCSVPLTPHRGLYMCLVPTETFTHCHTCMKTQLSRLVPHVQTCRKSKLPEVLHERSLCFHLIFHETASPVSEHKPALMETSTARPGIPCFSPKKLDCAIDYWSLQENDFSVFNVQVSWNKRNLQLYNM